MKVKHITQFLFESYKDAQTKFSQQANKEEVKQYLDMFKELSKKGTVSGQEKDIGYWIKQGWNSFKEFVDSKSQERSKGEVKKAKKKDSIVVYDDSEKMVVIPLSKDASCYYGKNTKWCTAATESENHFLKYFYLDKKVLFYIIVKDTNKKYAAEYSTFQEEFSYFDEVDIRVPEYYFNSVTGISEEQLKNWYYDYQNVIHKAKNINNASKEEQIELYNIDKNIIKHIINPPKKLQYEIIKFNVMEIEHINNPSEEVQLEAVKHNPLTIKFIDNSSEEVQLEAVKRDGAVIKFIDNPSKEVQLEAIKEHKFSIQYLDNPSEDIQLQAVKKGSVILQYIKNPTEKVKQLHRQLWEGE